MSEPLPGALRDVSLADLYEVVERRCSHFRGISRDEAVEVAHEVMIVLLRKSTSDPSYMKTADDVLGLASVEARNQALKYLDKKRRVRVDSEAVATAAAPRPDEMDEIKRRYGTCEQMAELLTGDDEPLREVFLPLCRKDVTQDQLAQRLGCSTITVRRRWNAAKSSIADRLGVNRGDEE